jgi:hypothetical protein
LGKVVKAFFCIFAFFRKEILVCFSGFLYQGHYYSTRRGKAQAGR